MRRGAPTDPTTSSHYFEQHCAAGEHMFHKMSSSNNSNEDDEENEEDDFAQTYCGGDTQRASQAKADNKYSQKALQIQQSQKPPQTNSFDAQKQKFKAYVRDQWSRTSFDGRGQPQHVQLRPHSNETSERTNNDYHSAVVLPQLLGKTAFVNKKSSTLGGNSNSMIQGSVASNTVNFSQTANELSAILPPRHHHHHNQQQRVSLPKAKQQASAALKNNFQKAAGHRYMNDYTNTTSVEDPSRHILSREYDEEGTMILEEFEDAEQQLQSSFARKKQSALSNFNRPASTFNPFRSKSTPPLPQTTYGETSAEILRRVAGIQPYNHSILGQRKSSAGAPVTMEVDRMPNEITSSSFALRKTSSGQILQCKQSRQIEELESVIAEKMGMIKQIDQMIQANQTKKLQETQQQRAQSTPQMPARRTQSHSPVKSRSSNTNLVENQPQRKRNSQVSRGRSSKSKSRVRESKIQMLQKKKNRYKTKLIALRQHAQMQDQQIARLSQNLTGVESQACTVRNENDRIQNQLLQLQKDYARQSEEMTTQQGELQTANQLIAQLKMELGQRGETLLEIKREHTDMQINGRKLVSDLYEKERELKAMQDDFAQVLDENKAFKTRFEEQEEVLAELKKVNQETQKEFDAFKEDMETKNSLIKQLKEQIKEVTETQRREDEKLKRHFEIDQLKELIAQMTSQINRKSIDQSLGTDRQNLREEAVCTEAEEDEEEVDHEPVRGAGYRKNKVHHVRATSCATQTEDYTSQVLSQDCYDKCSCCQMAEERNQNYNSCCQQSNEGVTSPVSHHQDQHSRVPHHQKARQALRNHANGDSRSSISNNQGVMNPYKRRSSSVQSPASQRSSSCCHSNQSRGRSQSREQLAQLQMQRQQDSERIGELEAFCTELVKQVEHWRRLDKQGRLIHARIEEQLISQQLVQQEGQIDQAEAAQMDTTVPQFIH